MEIRTLRDNAADAAAFATYRSDWLNHDVANPYSRDIRARMVKEADYGQTMARTLQNLQPEAEWRVPQLDYYLFADSGAIVGETGCRLAMTPQLAETGGHIGYAVAPSQRGHGAAGQLLDFALAFFRRCHEPYVIITAFKGNAASRHVIESRGGVLQEMVTDDAYAEPLCIYRIYL